MNSMGTAIPPPAHYTRSPASQYRKKRSLAAPCRTRAPRSYCTLEVVKKLVNGMAERTLGKPRLVITHLELENFKSYAGVQRIGPFHKARARSPRHRWGR